MSTYAISVPQASIGQSTTCLACGIRLPSLETQQQHHKSDWHTYNLKRKMVGLPPVPAEVFSQLVTASREQANPAEVPQPECVPCGKKYLSFQAFENHQQSKKHKQIAALYEKKMKKEQEAAASTESEATDSTAAETSTTTTTLNSQSNTTMAAEQKEPSETVCLFCSHESEDGLHNYDHMYSVHGFFLPSSERLIDLEGMLEYLAEKLTKNLDCLWCTPSVFSQDLKPDQEIQSKFKNLASVRRHMLDKGHCKLAMDRGAEREFADFYLSEDAFDGSSDEAAEDEVSSMDEDEQQLNSVLVDEDGNWILPDSGATAGIKIDPKTNELVLNNRRLTPKDAVRRQKVESRSVTLAPRSNETRQPQTSDPESAEAEADATNDDKDNSTALSKNTHQPGLHVSKNLLKSQNQLSKSTMSVGSKQLGMVAVKNQSAQDFEVTKRERLANKLGLNANVHARRHFAATWGTKV
ncbi:pre-60S factor REI1 [Entomortierella parvispora]|uniref:Pre-60S factor REI1 n=1 Tax=Entomortierella parvispora TaxID=205924 RepID=A0A9P3H0M9_9FUNG|nr:pre-60S factor REI1 [Entomortierella parvispora]